MEKRNNRKKQTKPQRSMGNLVIWMLMVLGLIYVFNAVNQNLEKPVEELTYSKFFEMVKDNPVSQKIKAAVKTDNIVKGELSGGEKFVVNVPESDQDLIRILRENIKNFDIKPPKTLWVNLFYSLGPMLLFILFLWLFAYRSPGGAGGGKIWAFGKSRATLASDQNLKVTFADVAGVDEAKEELKEVIEFLKDPRRFQRLGGKIPKGVLLMGHPGTGKTLLAKAVAGEANVPFLSISGSDFVEMFVGVGASRVRDLFEQAKRSAKTSGRGAIIFIDEIDAVGRQRFAGIGGGHDEREQTLNALLVEMDGFNTQEGVILIAATNRPDVLDPALLRPGRFDRQIVIDMPDIVGREAILKVHAKGVKLDTFRVNFQDGLAPHDVRHVNDYLPVEPARPEKRRVEDIWPVRRRDQDNPFLRIEPVHLHQERVQRLLSLVVAAAYAGKPLAADCIDLVDKYDGAASARLRRTLRLLE